MDVIQQPESDDNFQYLSVPPPSPLEEWPKTNEKLRKSRKKIEKKALIRRKIPVKYICIFILITKLINLFNYLLLFYLYFPSG